MKEKVEVDGQALLEVTVSTYSLIKGLAKGFEITDDTGEYVSLLDSDIVVEPNNNERIRVEEVINIYRDVSTHGSADYQVVKTITDPTKVEAFKHIKALYELWASTTNE